MVVCGCLKSIRFTYPLTLEAFQLKAGLRRVFLHQNSLVILNVYSCMRRILCGLLSAQPLFAPFV